jgi:pilus assembly protein CpaE
VAEQRIKTLSKDSFQQGKIINVIGSKGGIGTTTIAVNLAVSLAEKKGVQSVALIDMNLLFGDIPLFLMIEPKYDWGEITDRISRLDDILLKNILSIDPSGVCVLPSPSYLNNQNVVTPGIMVRLLMLMQKVFDFVIIDGGQSLDDISLKILELSDTVLLISILSPPCLLNTNKLLKTFHDLGFPLDINIKILVNRYLKKSNISIKDAETLIEKDIFWTIPNDYQTTVTAINEGEPLVQFAPRKAVAKNFRKLANKLALESEKPDLSFSLYQQPIKKESNKNIYIYQKNSIGINKGRRVGDKVKDDSGSKEKSRDRRRKTRDGIIIVDYDRRQNDDTNYGGPEKRSGVERRSGKDRRRKDS